MGVKITPTSPFVITLHSPVQYGHDFLSRMLVPPSVIPKRHEMSHFALGGPVIRHCLVTTTGLMGIVGFQSFGLGCPFP